MQSVREFLQSTAGKVLAIAAIVLCIGAAAWSIWSNVGQDSAVKDANALIFMDIENGRTFKVIPTADMPYPYKSPFTGHMTCYHAELCGWTKDGHVRSEPFAVVLNSELGKSGPTFCPDCGRLVVPHNPVAVEGHRPPPTQQEYMLSHQYP
jgi:hypothetical protein